MEIRPLASNGAPKRGDPPAIALVVDDEEAGYLLLLQRFRKERKAGLVDFLYAQTGQDALMVLEAEAPIDVVLILSDLLQFGMPALALLKAIKTTFPAMPVFLATDSGDPGYLRKALASGAYGYQIKPIDYKRLKRDVFGLHLRGGGR